MSKSYELLTKAHVPRFSDNLERERKEHRVVLGGCCVTGVVGMSTSLYFGIGSTIMAFSLSETSPSLPSIRYLIFSCFTMPAAGSPPKLSL